MTHRASSALSNSVRPLRSLFAEEGVVNTTWWHCRLCGFSMSAYNVRQEPTAGLDALYALAKHARGHLAR